MHFLQAINSDIRVLIVFNKTGDTIKGDMKKNSAWGIDVCLFVVCVGIGLVTVT